MSVYSAFTNRYSLQKTLRFELVPVGETLKNMRKNLLYDEKLRTFLKDQNIENAYQKLKPLIDKLHEDFITDSLSSGEAKKIDFSEYFVAYGSKKDLNIVEKRLRDEIGKVYIVTGEYWKNVKYPQYSWKKGSKVASGSNILLTQDVLSIIRDLHEHDFEIKTMIDVTLKGFFTYFSGFNQNRENYYTFKEEKTTAVATRIVHENLPKFCDNILIFDSAREDYLNAYEFLKQKGRELIDKEGKILSPISESLFRIEHFPDCLSQEEIEKYNAQIGEVNFIINLYNQSKSKEQGFKPLRTYKTLYKQIGCGKRKSLFFHITCDTKFEAEKLRAENKEAFSVQEILGIAKRAGQILFADMEGQKSINTVHGFCNYISSKDNLSDLYWSKAALNTISNKYFANYHDLKDRLVSARIFEKASKTGADDIKIPEVIELGKLFQVLDQTESWKNEGILFKKSITEARSDEREHKKNEKRKNIIQLAEKPSQALLQLVIADIKEQCEMFLQSSIMNLDIAEYKSKEAKEEIKSWMDHALVINQMMKYFSVKESKIKGSPLDSNISNALKNILFETTITYDGAEIYVDWFQWYDALRNYLTKKPQDEAKENKLKLNFENGSLLQGWSDGQEKNKASVILRNGKDYYLGVLKKRTLFDTSQKENPIYKNTTKSAGRLILANLKFQTLAGKGFLGEFGMSYGKMGAENPTKAIMSLQKIIKDRYLKKHPLLKELSEKTYDDKKEFDREIQEVLSNCYICEFTPINWFEIEKQNQLGNMYLFQIRSKDDGEKSFGKSNLQTLYWRTVFQENSPFQLNGGGEIFYRKSAISDQQKKFPHLNKSYIINNNRFTNEKFLFHCPIKLNYKAKQYSNPKYALPEINNHLNDTFANNENIHFLGIDRGEKHLAYYSLIDRAGKIIEQGSLNLPFIDQSGNPRSIRRFKSVFNKKLNAWEDREVDCWDYNDLLDAIASNRDRARKNWQTIGSIKDLKDGYISQVVRKIADLAVKNNALIILEDLNTGFKRGRQKIEKSVYQKFELALAKKLNFLVDKSAKLGEIGSVTNALQLTSPVNNYGDIENKKQMGVMFYTRANYTSQTDPVTGWRKKIYLKKSSDKSIKEQILKTFEDIRFDGKDYYFEYVDGHKKWRLYSGKDGVSLDRYRGIRGKEKNEWIIEKIDVTRILDQIFLNFDKSRSLLAQMNEGKELERVGEREHFSPGESLHFALEIIQQIRNNGISNQDDDFLLSPVRDQNNTHFDSRSAARDQPKCGDANGAYNIARKGLMMHEHINQWIKFGKPKYDKNSNDLNLYISDTEWDMYVVDSQTWHKKLPILSSRKALEDAKKHTI